MSDTLIMVSVALIGGLLMSRLAKRIGLPAVTAYLIAGLLLGPFCIGKLGISGLGFKTSSSVESLKIISEGALGFIAFVIGDEFRLPQLKSMGKQAVVVGILQAVITTILVDIVLIALSLIKPEVITLSSAITLGAIAAATAPAATLMVVKQYKAEGPLTKLLLMVVALDDAVGLVLFAASYGIACALEMGVISVVSIVVEPLLEIVLSLVLGSLLGYLLTRLEVYFHSGSKRTAIAIAFVLFAVGFSMKEFTLGGVHLSFSLLLVCMMEGTIFCNLSSASEELMERVDTWTGPLNMLFFVISGAELNLSVLSNPTVLLIGILFILSRSFGKMSGAYLSTTMVGCSREIRRNLGITLLPQAGVALGMAITAANLSDGIVIRNVVLFSVLVYELVGPTLTKRSLLDAGEIKPEERKSSRTANQGKKTFSLK